MMMRVFAIDDDFLIALCILPWNRPSFTYKIGVLPREGWESDMRYATEKS